MSQKKSDLLGENFSTASGKLRKMIMFDLIQRLELNTCYRCTLPIETVETLSIEHTEAWQSAENPKEVFYDLSKIAFSHLVCNVSAANRVKVWQDQKSRQHAKYATHYERNKEAILAKKKEMRSQGKWT
jgi:hypothetical protein